MKQCPDCGTPEGKRHFDFCPQLPPTKEADRAEALDIANESVRLKNRAGRLMRRTEDPYIKALLAVVLGDEA